MQRCNNDGYLLPCVAGYAGKIGPGDRRGISTEINWGLFGAKTAKKKSPDFLNLGFFVPKSW
jgi:hypothetical protein